jgi:predicted ATPase
VAPVARSNGRADTNSPLAVSFSYANLPTRLSRMVGRADDVFRLSAQLTAARFVTIGGVGKTTVAVAVGHHLIESFAGAALFVDLGMLTDPALVATAVASMLGLSVQSDDPTPNLISFLRERRVLLILDTCEHLIEAVAAMHLRFGAGRPSFSSSALTAATSVSPAGKCKYRFLDFRLGVVFHRLQLKMRDVG